MLQTYRIAPTDITFRFSGTNRFAIAPDGYSIPIPRWLNIGDKRVKIPSTATVRIRMYKPQGESSGASYMATIHLNPGPDIPDVIKGFNTFTDKTASKALSKVKKQAVLAFVASIPFGGTIRASAIIASKSLFWFIKWGTMIFCPPIVEASQSSIRYSDTIQYALVQ